MLSGSSGSSSESSDTESAAKRLEFTVKGLGGGGGGGGGGAFAPAVVGGVGVDGNNGVFQSKGDFIGGGGRGLSTWALNNA